MSRVLLVLTAIGALGATLAAGGFADSPECLGWAAGPAGADAFANLDRSLITTGILHDRVLPLAGIEHFDGRASARTITLSVWKQAYSEMYRASLVEPDWPPLEAILDEARPGASRDVIPVAIMNFRYTRVRPDAFESGALAVGGGRLQDGNGEAYVDGRVFAVAALKDYTYRGATVRFDLGQVWYFTNDAAAPAEIAADFDDGLGFRSIGFGEQSVSYATPGRRTIEVRLLFRGGEVLRGSFSFDVRALVTPVPDDTLAVTATIPYNGGYGSGEAYVYLADQHESLANPVIVIEGFDLDNDMNWEELYALLNQQGLAESLRVDGFDAVVLNFTDATDYIQKNAFVAVELVQQVKSAIGGAGDLAIVGASMGGLIGRYVLAYMEANGLDHRTRTFISFDSPHKGADIPLGIQYWVQFFSGESESAAQMLSQLNTPAARQLLVYHLTDPAGTTGAPDPLRTSFLGDLAAVGDYPAGPRLVAVANGSGLGANQGFPAGDQIIYYEYNSFLVDIRGNVWAVADGASQLILQGLIDRIWPLSDDHLNVTVSGTLPYDNAPGGWRSSMATMDSTEAPYGDIVALHPAHCFIPTISALALATADLFYDIAGDPDLLAHTPFDTLYYPAGNEEHVTITPESAVWFRTEIGRGDAAGVVSRPKLADAALVLLGSAPNPFVSSTAVRFSIQERQRVSVRVYDLGGRLVRTLIDGMADPGVHELAWDGRSDRGMAAAGIYFCRVEVQGSSATTKMVMAR